MPFLYKRNEKNKSAFTVNAPEYQKITIICIKVWKQ